MQTKARAIVRTEIEVVYGHVSHLCFVKMLELYARSVPVEWSCRPAGAARLGAHTRPRRREGTGDLPVPRSAVRAPRTHRTATLEGGRDTGPHTTCDCQRSTLHGKNP
jgi:hypothetical protein